MKPCLLFLILALSQLFLISDAFAQDNKPEVHGNFSMDGQYYRPDPDISAVVPDEQMALQGFGNIIYTQGKFEAGIRFETYVPAFVGFPAGAPWSGTGIGYRYARYNADKISITVGSFYEQFGSGMVLRTWEDRGLGVDYAIDGIRVVSKPHKGVTLKGLYGKQRFNFESGFRNGDGIIRGIDAEININELLDSTIAIPGQLSIGGSFVSKFEENRNSTWDFPENVDAASLRINYLIGGFFANVEYARIGNNPTAFNSQIIDIPNELDPLVGLFQYGQGINANFGYSTKGLGIGLTANSLSNMGFQSQRNAGAFDSWINFLPPTSVLQTALLAQFYPYATQPNGEVAFRGELFYTFKKESLLGGKYGTKLDLVYTQVNAPDYELIDDFELNRKGINPSLFRPSDRIYYADFTAKVSKKINTKFKGSLLYMNILYDNDVIQGAYDFDDIPARGVVYADLYVFEGNWSIKRGHSLRFELQLLNTDQHLQDWAAVIVEYTASPHWFVSAVNQYNYGNADGKQYNFPVLATGYIKDSHRIMLSYGRQRAGVFCVGGVCRVVPASNGLTVGITSSF
jgi:hypothetical protein